MRRKITNFAALFFRFTLFALVIGALFVACVVQYVAVGDRNHGKKTEVETEITGKNEIDTTKTP